MPRQVNDQELATGDPFNKRRQAYAWGSDAVEEHNGRTFAAHLHPNPHRGVGDVNPLLTCLKSIRRPHPSFGRTECVGGRHEPMVLLRIAALLRHH